MVMGLEDSESSIPTPPRSNDEIVIEPSDLVEEYPSVTPSGGSDEYVEITETDLAALDHEDGYGPARANTGWAHAHTSGAPGDYSRPEVSKSDTGITATAPVQQGLLFGAIGGFLAWAFQEALFQNDAPSRATQADVIAEVALWAAVIGLIVGAVLGSAEGLASRVSRKAWIGAAWGAGLGFIGGLIGGAIAQAVYGAARSNWVDSMGAQIAIRALGWAIFGLGVGLAQGAAHRKWKKAGNGLIGGAIGGFVGGVLFDPIGTVIGGGTASRMVAITVLGAAMGAAIGVVEQVRKQAWLQVVAGPLKGKQFIVYGLQTTIGSSPKCDIVLPKDPAVASVHAEIRREQNRSILTPYASGLRLDSNQVERAVPLRSGQNIGVGGTWLLYMEKRASTVTSPEMIGTR